MNKFLERSILDELYEAKSDEFANAIKEQNKLDEKSFKVEEELTNRIKEIIADEKLQEEILNKLNEFEMELSLEQDLWNKMFYKLGVYNCTEMKDILLNKMQGNKEVTKTFFDEYTDDFLDYLEEYKAENLNKNCKYNRLQKEIEKIKEENPNVRIFLEEKEAVPLTDVEQNAVLDILDKETAMEVIELKVAFRLGLKEMLHFIM